MRFNTFILMSGVALALCACNRGNDQTTIDATNATVDNAIVANTAAAPTTAQDFANAAAASDRFEIDSSKLAASSAGSSAVKDFAMQMVTAHTSSSAKLKSAVAGMNPPVTPSDTLNAEQQQQLDSLKGKKGADFDSAYAAAQVAAHQAALDALNDYAASGDNAALKDLARGMIPTVTAHLNMAKGLK